MDFDTNRMSITAEPHNEIARIAIKLANRIETEAIHNVDKLYTNGGLVDFQPAPFTAGVMNNGTDYESRPTKTALIPEDSQ